MAKGHDMNFHKDQEVTVQLDYTFVVVVNLHGHLRDGFLMI